MTKKVKKEVQLVLKKAQSNLGKVGNLINVRSGYARNYLIPLNIAELSTLQTIKLMQQKKKNIDSKEMLYVDESLKKKTILEQSFPYLISKRTNQDNKIFGKVTLKQVRMACETKTNLDLTDAIINLPDDIKHIGIFPVTITLHRDITAQINIEVIAQ
jgi:large subunit ribosomal protein L9